MSRNSETVIVGDSDNCKDYDIEFGYDFQEVLDNQVTSGTLTDSIELNVE